MIRETGRTDFQNGDARAQFDRLQRLIRLPENTFVFPAHDYKGDMVSTIGEEKRFNPRLQVKGPDEYAALMASLNLPNPKMMDVAVPANINQGFLQAEIAWRGWSVHAAGAKIFIEKQAFILVDLREAGEREKSGEIPGALHAPFANLEQNMSLGGSLYELTKETGMPLLFYCAFGEHSAMAVFAAQNAGLSSARHIEGGLGTWRHAYDI